MVQPAWLVLKVMPFFNKLGFECPAGKGDADFLQDVTIKKGQDQFRKNRKRKHDYMTVQVSVASSVPWLKPPLPCTSRSDLAKPWYHSTLSEHAAAFWTHSLHCDNTHVAQKASALMI